MTLGVVNSLRATDCCIRPTEDVAKLHERPRASSASRRHASRRSQLCAVSRARSRWGLSACKIGMITLDALARPLSMASTTLEDALAGRPASFSWQAMLNGQLPEPADVRRLIEVRPVLNFSALQPGEASSKAIRQAASDLKARAKIPSAGSAERLRANGG